MFSNKGLHVDENGELLLGDEKFWGMGLNFFDGFARTSERSSNKDFETSMQIMSQNKIPFIRLMFGEYYAIGLKEYRDNPSGYFARMDRFIRAAEQYKIGVIASLFWWIGGFPDLAGESINHIGKPDSKTIQLAKQYVRDVVTRYKDSKALWGWEIGNEYNLSADIGSVVTDYGPVGAEFGAPEVRTKEDLVSSEDVSVFYREISTAIRTIDPYRIIINGDADYRPAQYHLRSENQWIQDTEDELQEIIKVFSPDPINILSVHIYELEQERLHRCCTFEDLLAVYKSISKELKKPLYLGEFGASDSKERMQRQFQAILEADVILSSPWNYNMIGLTHGSFTDAGYGDHMFYGTVDMNRVYRESGRQNTEKYWE